MNKVLWLCSLFLFCGQLFATEDLIKFDDSAKQQLYRQLTAELRCPKCQNQNIADSNAVVAVDMRHKTYQLVQQGQSYDDVIAYMKSRYGDFVHYQPPLRLSTLWLWLLPALLVMILWWSAWRRSRPWRSDSIDGMAVPPNPASVHPLADELQAMIDHAVAQEPSNKEQTR